MTNQLFKENIPSELLFGLLEYINAFKSEKYYVINNDSFKKAQFKNLLDDFIKEIEPYYHGSKSFYLKRTMTYARFLTIIRQICKSNSIKYVNEIRYIKSKYDIHYYIYFNNEEMDAIDATGAIDATDEGNSADASSV